MQTSHYAKVSVERSLSMSERRCGDAVALGLTAAICVAAFFLVGWQFIERKTEQRVSEHYARQNNQSVSPDSLKALCGSLPPSIIADCIIQNYQEQDRWDKERRELSAQESMAFWAAWMFVLTALALVAIVRTLHHTGRAADYADGMLTEAKRTTDAALQTVNETRLIGEAQLREARDANRVAAKQFQAGFKPWISVELKGPFFRTGEDDPLDHLKYNQGSRLASVRADAFIQCVGEIPATIEDFDMKLAEGPEWPYVHNEPRHRAPPEDFFAILRSKETVQIHPSKGITSIPMFFATIEFTAENRADIGMNPPPIEGKVIYSDPMGVRYEHHFAFVASPSWGKTFKRYGGLSRNYEKQIPEESVI